MYTCYIQSFKILASFCSWAGWFESYKVENPWRHVFAWCGSNCVDLDHTAPLVWSGSTLFAHTCLSENLGTLCYTCIWLSFFFSEIKKWWQHVCENSHRQFLSSVSTASCKNFVSITWAGPNKKNYRKNLKNSDTGKNCCNDPKISTWWLYHRVHFSPFITLLVITRFWL